MNSRPLSKLESSILMRLNDAGIESALIFLTETGLKKSILDATFPVRELLLMSGIHDFCNQGQGVDKKVKINSLFFTSQKLIELETSLYRPKTKKGDPRMWPSRLHHLASPNQVLATFVVDKKICFVNLSEESLISLSGDSPLDDFLEDAIIEYNSASYELLERLRLISKNGLVPAEGYGSTSIGRTIETSLGISINSSESPDYKGIEIKAKRARSNTRSTLFAKVADWNLSNLKSSREILDTYGYVDGTSGNKKLYCTVTTKKPNTQGLVFDLNLDLGVLEELFQRSELLASVAIWKLDSLHEKLHSKHKETFWINALEIEKDGKKYFKLKSIRHTRKPSSMQFDRLLGAGDITMDHLIKIKSNGQVSEKGPLFKIKPDALPELFLGKESFYKL